MVKSPRGLQRPRSCFRGGVTPSRVLGGRYALLERIGSGGMADVYRATDRRLGREVAVKVLRPMDGDPAFVERFRREARHAAGIQHPNVAAVYDVGEDGDDRYIVMELVRGQTLKDLVRARGALPEDEAITIAEHVARGLQAAHARGVVHRDLKAQNVLLGADGQPRIVDFGIAKGGGGTALTNTAAVLGTAHYFSPEQASGAPADHRSDLYSLGVVLFELLTGAPPFDGQNPVEIAMRHVSDPPRRPSAVRPGLRRATDEAVLRALAKDPDQRYPSAAAMAVALARARDGSGPVAVRGVPPPRRARSALLLPGLVGIALLLGGAALARAGVDRPAQARPTVAAFTARPAATPAPSMSAAASVPASTSAPSSTSAPTAPATPVPTRAPAVLAASSPSAAVAGFYTRVAGRDFAGAAALWTDRMKANYPPAQFIDGRFADTSGLQLLRNETVSEDLLTGRATVSIDLVETTSAGTRRWAGTWQLVRAGQGWLLDRPALSAR